MLKLQQAAMVLSCFLCGMAATRLGLPWGWLPFFASVLSYFAFLSTMVK